MSKRPADHPRRLTLSQIVEQLIAQRSRDRSSVTITRDSGGGVAIEVKVRVDEGGDIANPEDAEERARAIYGRLAQEYPPTNGHDNATISLTRNAKGETQIETQIKTSDNGIQTLDEATHRTWDIYDKTRGRYPMADGHSAKPGSVASAGGGEKP